MNEKQKQSQNWSLKNFRCNRYFIILIVPCFDTLPSIFRYYFYKFVDWPSVPVGIQFIRELCDLTSRMSFCTFRKHAWPINFHQLNGAYIQRWYKFHGSKWIHISAAREGYSSKKTLPYGIEPIFENVSFKVWSWEDDTVMKKSMKSNQETQVFEETKGFQITEISMIFKFV